MSKDSYDSLVTILRVTKYTHESRILAIKMGRDQKNILQQSKFARH